MTQTKAMQDSKEWDWDKAEARPGIRNRRVVVSVAFKSPEFQRVSSYAAKIGKKTSEFVREAALQAVPAGYPTVVPFVRSASLTTAGGPRVEIRSEPSMTAPSLQMR